MSALAKKMMEKYGWKEGEGLGKERSGMKSYVKVVRRDPNVATGLGHAADPAQGGSLASTHAVELDAIYGQLHKDKKRKLKKRARSNSSSDSDSSSEEDEDEADRVASTDSSDVEAREGVSRQASPSASNSGSSEGEVRNASKSSRRQQSASSDESSDSDIDSDSDSDSDDASPSSKRARAEAVGDVTRMTDKDLFQRCGGVRLGRAGRHRFFDGKLKRIHGEK